MPDNDGFYHIRLAALMRQEGLKPDFPWLPLSILNAREFYDHHFLFHVAQMPFTLGDLRLGAKWSAVFFAALAFLSVWWLLYRQRIRYAALWALGLLLVSEAFLYRMSIPRAQSLSLAVLALGLHWLLHRQYRWLIPLAFLYVWLYDAFPLLLALSGLYTLALWLVERRFDYRPLVYTGLGITLGLLVNPYFPANLVFIARHLLPKLLDSTALSVGSEWYPYTTGQLLSNSLPALLVFASGILALGLTPKRMDTRTATALLAALFFGLLLFQARRFIEYFPAFGLIFAAFAWQPLIEESAQAVPSGKKARITGVLAAFAMIALAAGMLFTGQKAVTSIGGSKPYATFAGASAWLSANTAAGERIFQTDWDDFPRLFYYNTHNTYTIGLDPTYMQLYNETLYDQWVQITRGQVEKPSRAILGRFGASYVISDLEHTSFIERADADPDMVQVYRDDNAVVYRVQAAAR